MKVLWSFGIILSFVAFHVDARVEFMSTSAGEHRIKIQEQIYSKTF